jgi:hypothetical protein
MKTSVKPFFCALLFAAALSLAVGTALAQEGPLLTAPPKDLTPQQIIEKFAAREKEFKEARDHYIYRQSAKVQTLDGDTPDGEYQQVVDILFDDQGRRIENVVFAPQSTLVRVNMSMEDMQDIEKLLPFVLTTEEIPDYDVTYAGQQQEDELHTYVFDIKPRMIDKKIRRFQGRVWVDDHDYQIVKVFGKGVSEANFDKKNQQEFPDFTTYREQIDGRYWFPTYSSADEVLHFKGNKNTLSDDVHIREIVKYTNYKRFGSESKILYEGKEVQKEKEPKK